MDIFTASHYLQEEVKIFEAWFGSKTFSYGRRKFGFYEEVFLTGKLEYDYSINHLTPEFDFNINRLCPEPKTMVKFEKSLTIFPGEKISSLGLKKKKNIRYLMMLIGEKKTGGIYFSNGGGTLEPFSFNDKYYVIFKDENLVKFADVEKPHLYFIFGVYQVPEKNIEAKKVLVPTDELVKELKDYKIEEDTFCYSPSIAAVFEGRGHTVIPMIYLSNDPRPRIGTVFRERAPIEAKMKKPYYNCVSRMKYIECMECVATRFIDMDYKIVRKINETHNLKYVTAFLIKKINTV